MKKIYFLPVFLFFTSFLTISKSYSQSIKFDNEYAIWFKMAPETENLPWKTYSEEWGENNSTVKWVTQPTIRVFIPKENKTDVAVIICPGGGYNMEVIEREGYKVAKKLNEYGITAIVLKYRHYSKEVALQDSKRAIQFVRSMAEEWGINSEKIGIGGFSAGGHLAANTGTSYDPIKNIEKDKISEFKSQPNFLMLIYPAFMYGLITKVDSNYPPCFIVVAADDQTTPVDDCIHFFNKFLSYDVPTELHVFQKGGHGFDIGNDACNCHLWVDLFVKWLETNKILE